MSLLLFAVVHIKLNWKQVFIREMVAMCSNAAKI